MQVIKLLHTEKAKGGTRLHFLVGSRALAALGAAAEHEAALNKVRLWLAGCCVLTQDIRAVWPASR